MSEPIAQGFGTSGWKARQERARMKHSHGKTQAERQAIREARRRHYEQQSEQSRKEKASPGKKVEPSQGEIAPATEGDGSATTTLQFDLSGNWMAKRVEVKEALSLDKVPASKAAVRELLERAGYEVTE